MQQSLFPRNAAADLVDRLTPALFRRLSEGYGRGDFRKDLIAGITVGIVALPLAMAFAIGAGATPSQGITTAIIAGFVIALFGGSFHQVSGPTGAFVVIIAEIIARYGMDGLHTATLLAGLILVLMGLTGLGNVIKFIPYPVTIGFTTGIGLIIFTGQLKDLAGMAIPDLSPDFFGKIAQYSTHLSTIQPWTLALGLATVLLILLVRRTFPRLPAAVIAVTVVTSASLLFGIQVETIGSRFGALPKGFPAPHFPAFNLSLAREVFSSAFTIAMLAAIESLLSAVVADGMTGTRHSASAELNAQGWGNIASILFGGIPATGAIARTATNIKAGAVSPVSAIVHSLVLLLFSLALGPLVQAVPLTALAGVLVMVAIDMSELPRFISMHRAPKSDLAVMLTTFILTVVVDLTAAVEVGVLLAVVLFVKRARDTVSIAAQTASLAGDPVSASLTSQGSIEQTPATSIDSARSFDRDDAEALAGRKIPHGCEIFEIDGPFFFGVADMLQDALSGLERAPGTFILRMRHVPAIDATGLNALRAFFTRCRHQGTALILSGVREQPAKAIARFGLANDIGAENICADLDSALARALKIDSALDTRRRSAI